MKIKITETRVAYLTPEMSSYEPEDRTAEGVIKVEKQNSKDFDYEYMDMVDGDRNFTFEIIEE
jgi:hypothetical protein